MLLDDVSIDCRTSMLQRLASLNPKSPFPETLLAASSWAPVLPKLCYDPQGRYFQRMPPCSRTQGPLCWVSISPLSTHALGVPPFSWEGMPVAILGIFTCSLLGLIDASLLLLSSHSHSCRDLSLQDIKQIWADFFKSCFYSSSEQITLSFLFQIQEYKTLWKEDKGKYLVLFLFLLFFHLVWETRPCGYSQDEMYSPVPCQLLMVSDSPVSSTAAVNSHTLLAVALHPCLLGQCIATEPHGHAWSLSHSPDDN